MNARPLDDLPSLQLLYAAAYGRAVEVVQRIVHLRHEAEDVVQEAFLEACATLHHYDGRRGSPEGWLISIARSRALDRLRKNGNRRRCEGNAAVEWSAHVEEAADGAQKGEVVACLSQLSRPQRVVLLLAYFEGMSQTEIAASLGLPLGTVKSHARRALERLAELLD